MVITLISNCCQQNEKWVIYWVKWFFYLVWLFADSTEPPTFESVIDPLEKARVPLYYSLYTGRQLGSGKAGRYFDAYKKVYSTRPRDCNSHLSVWTIISLVLDWLKGSLMIMNEFNKIWYQFNLREIRVQRPWNSQFLFSSHWYFFLVIGRIYFAICEQNKTKN